VPDGMTLSSTGLLSGTPTDDDPFTMEVTVTDSISATGDLSYSTTIDPAITMSPTTLPVLTLGGSFSQQLTASGGSGTGYSFAATGVPDGMTLSSTGLLSGTPIDDDPFTMDVTVTDSISATGDLSYSITIDPAITLSPTTLPVPTVGESYSHQLTASGGSGSGYSFAATGVPAGLTLSSTGLLSGTPTSATPYTMDVTVTDSISATGSLSYPIIVDLAILISPTTLPIATVGSSYSDQLTATGGSGSGYVFSSGALPPGLTLSAGGLLSGTPTSSSGTPFTVDVTVTDSVLGTGSMGYSLAVKSASQAGSLAASSPQTFYGETVVLTATFSATADGSAPMTGTVMFYDGTTYLGTAPLTSTSPSAIDSAVVSPDLGASTASGQASLSTSSLTVGDHVITAVYSGDSNYSGATSETPVSLQVAPATTSTTLTSSTTNTGTVLTATVVVTSPGNPPVVGNVSFYEGTTLLGTAPVTGGVATLNIGTLAPGSQTLSASFAGNGTSSTSGTELTVEIDGPQVMSVVRYGYSNQPTILAVSFNGPISIASADNVSNYRIVGPGGHRIKIKSAVYNAETNQVILKPAKRLPIFRKYMLTIDGTTSSSLANPAGLLLDGAGTGTPGSNHVTSVTWRNFAGQASQVQTLARVDAVAKSLAVRVKSLFHRHSK
jgi:large repetitive protein